MRLLLAVAVTVGTALLATAACLAVLFGLTGGGVLAALLALVLVWLGVLVLVRIGASLYLAPVVVALPLALIASFLAVSAIASGWTIGWFIQPRIPTTIGVIERSENIGPSTWRYALHTGDDVTIDYDTFEGLSGSAGGQNPGTLLLVGHTGSRHWYMSIAASQMRPAGRLTEFECFRAPGDATEGANTIDFANGLRLRKAPGFDPSSHFIDGRPSGRGGSLCVTEDGEVLF